MALSYINLFNVIDFVSTIWTLNTIYIKIPLNIFFINVIHRFIIWEWGIIFKKKHYSDFEWTDTFIKNKKIINLRQSIGKKHGLFFRFLSAYCLTIIVY